MWLFQLWKYYFLSDNFFSLKELFLNNIFFLGIYFFMERYKISLCKQVVSII